MLSLNHKRLIPVIAVAALLGGLASAPASAATRHHRHQQQQTEQSYQALQPEEAAPTAEPAIMRDSESGGGCYATRIQEPVVGAGLQWVPELPCPHE